jgi:hypothetical protein
MKYNEEQIPIDILRKLVNRTLFKGLPSMVLINGEGQGGKSTAVFHIANRLEQILKYGNNWRKHENEWNLWDYNKYCTTDLEQLVNTYESSFSETIVLEEAADQGLDTTSYFEMFSQAFAKISRTQGFHLNRVFLITPFAADLLKIHKRKINFLLWVKFKDVVNRRAVIGIRKVAVNHMTLDEKNIKCKWRRDYEISYTKAELEKATEYTNWLKGFKRDIMQNIKNDVKNRKENYNPNKKMSESNCPQWVREQLNK